MAGSLQQGNRVLIWDTWGIVIPAPAGIQEMHGVSQCPIWQGTLDSGPVSEYGVTFFRRNDGLSAIALLTGALQLSCPGYGYAVGIGHSKFRGDSTASSS